MSEPRAAVANIENVNGREVLKIWTGTQDLWAIKRHAAMDLPYAEDDVIVYPMRMGGGFGGREHYDHEMDAARFAHAMRAPVKVQWTREDEFMTSRSRPASAHRVKLRSDSDGNLTNLWYAYITGHVFLARDRLPDWLMPFKRIEGDLWCRPRCRSGLFASAYQGRVLGCRFTGGPWASGVHSMRHQPYGHWRVLLTNWLGKQGKDPVDFRLHNITTNEPRLADCLSAVKELAGDKPADVPSRTGRGFACGIYEHRCYVAVCADVSVDPETRTIQVTRLSLRAGCRHGD